MSISEKLSNLNYDSTKARRDLIAGLTVAAVSLPQGITYALVAGVDAKFGVYSAIVVTFVASVFGSSSHLINGPTSAISLLVFSSLAFLDPENRTVLFESLFLLGVLVGTFQILIAVFKLGDLTRYISESIISGFILAAAVLIALGELGNALGVKDRGNGRMSVLKRTYLTLFHGDAINYRAVLNPRRGVGQPHRWLLPGGTGFGFGVALADSLPGWCGYTLLRGHQCGGRRGGSAALRAVAALYA